MRKMKTGLLKTGGLLIFCLLHNILFAHFLPTSSKASNPIIFTPPIAVDDTISMEANTLIKLTPASNDILNGQLIALAIVETPRNGSVGFASLDTLTYMPNNGFCGRDTIYYRVCNDRFECDTAMIEIIVSCSSGGENTNPFPVAQEDIASTFMNTAVDINVLTNDSVKSALVKPLSITTHPKNGIAWVSNNRIIYLPNSLYCGNDTLMYDICNAAGCDTAFVYIQINCSNGGNNNTNQPIALDDTTTVQRNSQILIRPTLNDTLNGTLVGLSIVQEGQHGSISFAGVDTLIYVPQLGYCGSDTISYRICNQLFLCDTASIFINISCTIDPSGTPPQAFDDISSTQQAVPVTVSVLANDNLNGAPTHPLSIVNLPKHGLATVVMNEIRYTPDSSFCGDKDTISYQICNTSGCDTAELAVSVGCVVVVRGDEIIANDDIVTTGPNVNIFFYPAKNDTLNGELLSIGLVTLPKHGDIGFRGIDTLIYAPQPDYCGKDTMAYRICRADFKCDTANVYFNINCTHTGDRPDAMNDRATVIKNDMTLISVLNNDATNGTLTAPLSILNAPTQGTALVNGENVINYIPFTDVCNVADTLSYVICNEFGCDTAFVYINILCENVLKPVAQDDEAAIYKNTSIEINVLANDTLNGKLESITITKAPQNGTSRILNNNIVYAPNQDFCDAKDTVLYTICTKNGCDTGQFIITIACENRFLMRPAARLDSASVQQGKTVTISIIENDSLYASVLESVYIVESPQNGKTSTDANNNIVYTPTISFCNDVDSFSYAICTARGCDTAKVFVTVSCDSMMNIAPVAMVDEVITTRQTAIFIDILQNDSLYGADKVRLIKLARRGTVFLGADKRLFYQSDATFCGAIDSVIYEVCNIKGCDTALVLIAVACDTSFQIPPVANFDIAKVDINKTVKIPIFKNDTLRGSFLTQISVQPRHGIATIGVDSQIIYIPTNEYWGRDTFTYIACNLAGCDTAMVYITVQAGADIVVYNAFSPNNDNMNDKFIIRGIENYPNNELIIFNRWGNEIYRKKGYNNDDPWNGLWENKQLMDGTYFYVIFLNDDKQKKVSGYVQVHK